MADQRVQSKYAEHRRRGGVEPLESFDEPENRRWRPFQLAFILLNLAPLADPHHVDRGAGAEATADLLWFPTGGGKTEAYLGLAAFALAIRRLQGELGGRRGDAGVTVLMRYTLRVLTLQQFQRAAALVCACEVQRREAPERYGAEPFRIGLWVGGRTTPNSIAAAVEAMRAELGEGWVAGGSPRQLTSCPWCGSEIRASDVKGEPYPGGRARTVTYCGDTLGRCAFSSAGSPGEGLPVQTVDEEIYRRPPSVLIATVDKFAQLPWKGETQTLFGIVNGRCERHGFRSPSLEDADSHRAQGANPAARTVDPERLLRPPDLIVQDELHLISGPLGSMVGLYETVIDELSTWQLDGRAVRPKVIASTATVRRARQQVHRLFLRDVSVFPPPGLDASDSFFARERALSDEAPGRAYLGVCASGRRLKAVLIRVYVAYLAAARLLYERHGPLADPWLTLVGYFNSMQELAGMRRLCDDDVRSRLLNADARGLGRRLLAEGSVLELTSRISAREIPKTLDRMGLAFPAFADHKPRRDGPLDVLLATNMISVGVDVSRLGLMVVAGQPKMTSEYIQATSRVGRSADAPGIVCTVYNWARPRDLSHYERFGHYHETFYRHVEPLSVTPFAPRAIDRGIVALLVALIRLRAPHLNADAAAAELLAEDSAEAIEVIARRAGDVASPAAAASVRAVLEARIDDWLHESQRLAGQGARLSYERRDGSTIPLLAKPDGSSWGAFTCLNSLRDVEPTVALILGEP